MSGLSNLWVGIPTALSALSGIASLITQNQSSDIIRRATRPGAQPGTTSGQDLFNNGDEWRPTGIDAIDSNPYQQQIRDLLNQGAQYSPAIGALPAQLVENQRAAGARNDLYDQIIGQARGSRLGTLAPEVAKWRSDLTEKLDASKAGSVTGKLEGAATGAKTYFERVAENPNIFSTADIERMVGESTAANQASEASTVSDLEARAAAGNLSPQALAALKLQASTASGAATDAARRQLLVGNATASAGRADQAMTTLSQLLPQIYGAEGSYETAINNLIGSSFGTEAGIVSGYDDAITRALGLKASDQQPENLLLLGQLLDEVNRYNTAAQAGALADESGAYAGMFQSMLGFADAERTRRSQERMNQEQANAAITSAALGGGMNMAGDVTGSLIKKYSSRRFKTDIQPVPGFAGPVDGLQPVTYRYRGQPDARQVGFIAEDVATVHPDVVAYDEDGRPYAIDYAALAVKLLARVRELEARAA